MPRGSTVSARRSAIGFLLVTALRSAPGLAATPPDADAQPSSDIELKAAARLEVQAGSAAFAAGDFQLAIDHYEAAMVLLPAPKLHYNIGVCHQRLSLDAESSEDRTRQRDLAIESYNAYLEQNPGAEDRLDVAETIRELGGSPSTMPRLKPLFETDESTQTDTPPDPGEDAPIEVPPPPPQPPYPSHGRFGMFLLGGYSPALSAADSVDAKGLLALDIHGGGFVGRRRRFLLAAHTAAYVGATLRARGLSAFGYSVGLLGQQTWVAGREAVQIGFGGVVALTGQSLSARADVGPPLCSLDRGAQVAARSGALLTPRFDLGILLGTRRRGMIALLVQPGFAIFGDGPPGTACQMGETPWTSLGIRRRWQFQLWLGAGYSFRF